MATARRLIQNASGSYWGCTCMETIDPMIDRELVARGIIHQCLDVMQGCYSGGRVAASGATHNGGGVRDLAQSGEPYDSHLEMWGYAAFQRDWRDGMDPHTHAVLIGCPHLDPSAHRQVTAWMNKRNGLMSNAPDRDQTRPSTIRNWREAVEELNRLEEIRMEEKLDALRVEIDVIRKYAWRAQDYAQDARNNTRDLYYGRGEDRKGRSLRAILGEAHAAVLAGLSEEQIDAIAVQVAAKLAEAPSEKPDTM